MPCILLRSGKAVYLANGYLDEDYECPSGCEFACEDLSVRRPSEMKGSGCVCETLGRGAAAGTAVSLVAPSPYARWGMLWRDEGSAGRGFKCFVLAEKLIFVVEGCETSIQD